MVVSSVKSFNVERHCKIYSVKYDSYKRESRKRRMEFLTSARSFGLSGRTMSALLLNGICFLSITRLAPKNEYIYESVNHNASEGQANTE